MVMYSAACLLVLLLGLCSAADLQEKLGDVESQRGIGLEEVVLFLIGLGVASAVALSIVIGPLFAIFFATIQGVPFGGINNNGNTISTVAGGGSREKQAGKFLRDRLSEGIKLLEDAIKKYEKAG